ncbi:MAG: hypothetical protein JWL77_5867 [Chthonomonadaceae bacterium]|nr:hypothetical protein [Chthonomonadaceae bacterium]
MSEINLAAFLASRIRTAGANIEKAVGKMPADRQSWHPTVDGNEGRDTLDQLIECGLLNGLVAGAFQSGEVPNPDWDAYGAKKATLDSGEKIHAAFKEGTESLAAAIETCSPTKLAETFIDPFFQKEMSWAEFADFMYWNMCYHDGQINYIQVLYGDKS